MSSILTENMETIYTTV